MFREPLSAGFRYFLCSSESHLEEGAYPSSSKSPALRDNSRSINEFTGLATKAWAMRDKEFPFLSQPSQ